MPCVPYAWQPLGATRELPSFPSRRLNSLGFWSRDQPAFCQAVEGTVGAAQAIAAFDRFAADYALAYARHGQPGVVTLDNAPCGLRAGRSASRSTVGGHKASSCTTCLRTARN